MEVDLSVPEVVATGVLLESCFVDDLEEDSVSPVVDEVPVASCSDAVEEE